MQVLWAPPSGGPPGKLVFIQICVKRVLCVCVILGVLSVIDEDQSLLVYDLLICHLSPTFRSSLLPQSSGLLMNKLVVE